MYSLFLSILFLSHMHLFLHNSISRLLISKTLLEMQKMIFNFLPNKYP